MPPQGRSKPRLIQRQRNIIDAIEWPIWFLSVYHIISNTCTPDFRLHMLQDKQRYTMVSASKLLRCMCIQQCTNWLKGMRIPHVPHAKCDWYPSCIQFPCLYKCQSVEFGIMQTLAWKVPYFVPSVLPSSSSSPSFQKRLLFPKRFPRVRSSSLWHLAFFKEKCLTASRYKGNVASWTSNSVCKKILWKSSRS